MQKLTARPHQDWVALARSWNSQFLRLEGKNSVTVPRTRNRGNSPLTFPNKGKRNEVNHHEANNKTIEKEARKTCGHLQVKQGKSDRWTGVTANILVE